MAIKWGNYVTINGVPYRTGTDMSVSTSTSSATVTTKVYLGIPSAYNAYGSNGSYEVTGDESGSATGISYTIPTGGVSVLFATLTETVTREYGTNKTFTTNARIRPIYGAGTWTPVVSNSVTIPARPVSKPAAATNFSVSRSSDTRQNLTWTRNATTAAPYTAQSIRRRDNVDTAWKTVGNPSATATSWSDTSTVANREYEYQHVATNAAGSTNSASDKVDTTPGTMGVPRAARQANSDIVVTRGSLPSHATHWEVWPVTDGVRASSRSALVPAATLTWTHAAPSPASQHAYETRAVTDDPVLYSGYSSRTASILLESPPNAPTNLRPDGTVEVGSLGLAVSYQHNPVDGSEQRQREMEYRTSSDGTTWTTWTTWGVEVTSTESRQIGAADLPSSGFFQYRVRTWGNHADPSPFSAPAQITLTTAPTVTITAPSATVTTPGTTMSWTYSHPSAAQNAWETQVLEGSRQVSALSGNGTTASWFTGNVLENGKSYDFRVRVRSNLGVWSDWASVTQTVAFTPPSPPTVDIFPDPADGEIRVRITAGAGTPAVTSTDVERSIDGGITWEYVGSDLPPTYEFYDWTAPLTGTVLYRITSWSDLPSSVTVTHSVTIPSDGAPDYIWINGGPEFGVAARLVLHQTRSVTVGLDRALNQYAGRTYSVETSGTHREKTISVTGVIAPPNRACDTSAAQTSIDGFEEVFTLPGPHLYRDGKGRRFYCTLSNLQYDDEYLGKITFTVTQSDEGTLEQRTVISDVYVGARVVEVNPGEYRVVGGSARFIEGPGGVYEVIQ